MRGSTLDELITAGGVIPSANFGPLFWRLCEVVRTGVGGEIIGIRTGPGRTIWLLTEEDGRLRIFRGRHRFRLLVKSPRSLDLSAYLREWLAAAPKPRGNVRLEVDVDPQSFY